MKGRRYYNWSEVIPAWKIKIDASSTEEKNLNELSYDERYEKKKRFCANEH